jgi:hypothetical protein
MAQPLPPQRPATPQPPKTDPSPFDRVRRDYLTKNEFIGEIKKLPRVWPGKTYSTQDQLTIAKELMGNDQGNIRKTNLPDVIKKLNLKPSDPENKRRLEMVKKIFKLK